jgi:hypothetical protein
MNKRIQLLHDFFHANANRFTNAINGETPDIDGTVKSFSECFIAATPLGVTCGNNNEDFKTAMSQGYTFYKTIGVTSMEIVFLETTILDGFHEMTKIRWNCGYSKKKNNSKGNIEFENFYFTQTRENEPKIFAYITGDEQAALKEHGLI